MVGKFIKDSRAIQEKFVCDYINLTTSFRLTRIGKGSLGKLWVVLRILANVGTALLKERYDLCYITLTAKGAGFYKDFLIVLLLKLFRKKIVYHFHNKGVRGNSTNFLKRAMYRFTFKNTQSILLAPQLYSDISKYVAKDDVFFCPNGMPDIEFEQAGNTMGTAISSPCKFLFLSNMMEEKGVYVLLDACAVLLKKSIRFECHFVGAWSDVSEADFDNYVVMKKLQQFVFAHGAQYGDEKLSFLKNANVFVFPTFYHNEAFPLVNLEAMQQELPIISTPEGGIPEMVSDGQTGFLVDQRNVEALAAKMEVLIENPSLRKKMGRAGRELYLNQFTLVKFERRLKAILEEAIAKN